MSQKVLKVVKLGSDHLNLRGGGHVFFGKKILWFSFFWEKNYLVLIMKKKKIWSCSIP